MLSKRMTPSQKDDAELAGEVGAFAESHSVTLAFTTQISSLMSSAPPAVLLGTPKACAD
jgi:hypothetical protein